MFIKLVAVLSVAGLALCDVSHLFGKPSSSLLSPRLSARASPTYHSSSGSDAQVQILRQDSDIQPDGSYQFSFEAENGISAQEQGSIRQIGKDEIAKSAQGSFQWTSPEGQPIQISYIADENGYQPQGDLPTPPPIPAAIQKALEWIASHPQPEEPQRRF